MCGIVGIFDTRGRRLIDRSLLELMNETQHHRGPDEGGLHIEPGLGLGHRRLSIIDLSGGQQPLYKEEKSVIATYNGEIYNFQELTKYLIAKGHRFQSRCDTEVIVHAWEEWGEKCVDHFRGMFAFAIWDQNSQTLFLARDRLGIKPLYYAYLPDDYLIFASELKALQRYPRFPREIEPSAVEDYFAYGYIPEPKTIFQHAFKLPPGHTLGVAQGRPLAAPRAYWDVPFKPIRGLSDQDAEHELIERFRDAVGIRLVAEVPLGAFLSGGVDSSAVVAMMASLHEEPVNTCSIAFGDPAFNEACYAAIVAERYQTNHRVEEVDPQDFDLIDKLAGTYDEPYADSSAMPTYRVCELARKQVTVALSGDGGDENFAGYQRYRWHVYEERMRSLLPLSLRRPVIGALANIYPRADWAPKVLRAKLTLESIAKDSIEGYFHSVSILSDPLRRHLFGKEFRQALQGYRAVEVLREHARRAPSDHPLSLVQYLDMKTYLPGDILTKIDRASMAHALEVRVPVLDHEFVEWTSRLPPELKLRGREGKYVFKKALEPFLPETVLYREKMGFAVPLARWFRGRLKARVRKALLGPTLVETGFFDHHFLKHLVDQHESGIRDYSAPLWSLLMFEAFLRNLSSGQVASETSSRTAIVPEQQVNSLPH
jgi:asparagine synthase (glutamine-hydrolysing)